MSEAMATKDVGAYRVEVHWDQDAESPRSWDNVGILSGSSHRTTIFDEDRAQDAATAYRSAREAYGPIIAIPLKTWDGGMGTTISECSWDQADGIYYVPIAKLAEEWPGTFAEQVAMAKECMRAELRTLQSWCHGEAFGYIVFGPDGSELESCWGYIGEDDYAMSEGVRIAEWHAFKAACDWAALPKWVQLHVLAQADSGRANLTTATALLAVAGIGATLVGSWVAQAAAMLGGVG